MDINTKKGMEDFNKMLSTWVTPVLLGIVGFFVMGILNDVKDIKANQIQFVRIQTRIEAQMENVDKRIDNLERWVDEIDKTQREHEKSR